MLKAVSSLALVAMLTVSVSGPAFAQATDTTTVPDHPRVNEVDQRLQNQQNREATGVNSGTIGARQEERDTARDSRVSQQEARDEAKDGGHLTKRQDKHLNKELNHNSKRIRHQKKTPGTAAQ